MGGAATVQASQATTRSMDLGAEDVRALPNGAASSSASFRLQEPRVSPDQAKTVAQLTLQRDVVVRPGGPLDNVRRSPILPRVNGLYTLHTTDLENGWSLVARAGRSRDLNVRGLVAGLRYVPAPGVEIAPLELRLGKQKHSDAKVSVGARLSYRY